MYVCICTLPQVLVRNQTSHCPDLVLLFVEGHGDGQLQVIVLLHLDLLGMARGGHLGFLGQGTAEIFLREVRASPR